MKRVVLLVKRQFAGRVIYRQFAGISEDSVMSQWQAEYQTGDQIESVRVTATKPYRSVD